MIAITVCTAQILDPDSATDVEVLQRLRTDPSIEFIDRLEEQRDGLHKLRPAPGPELTTESCRWVYYPWRRTVVAVLGPRSFRALRLDRNRNLITTEEQMRLGALRIGVVGLSVGHVVAHTLAAQGSCGELLLADFDELELSNLNRVPATLLDLGLNKAQVAARRIAEIDPYLRVRTIEDGLTPDNVDDFLDGLDIVVEECDSLDMKVVVRTGARSRRIPVLMATSDRGLVDVERFDVEPDRPILHGLLGSADLARLSRMTSREKIPHMVRLLGAEQLSPRVVASAIEIDRTLSTWPQLAGDVVLGATAVAEAVRRIGLGEELRSGRVRLDIGAALDEITQPDTTADHPPPAESADPDLTGAAGLIATAAIRAPSAANAQPWHVHTNGDSIIIRLAPEHTSTLDVGLRGSAVSLGAAMYNAKVAAAAHHLLGPVSLAEDINGAPLQAALHLQPGTDPELAALYQPMLARETNRHLGKQQLIADSTIDLLYSAAEGEGAHLHLLTNADDIARAATILAAADRIRYLTPQLHAEMVGELRWPGDTSPDTGIDVRSLELHPADLAVLDILRRPEVMLHLAQWDAGTALGDDTRHRVLMSSAVAVIAMSGASLTDYARGGSAAEAVWVAAQQHGLAVQPISPVFLYAGDGDLTQLSPRFADQLEGLRRELWQLAGLPADSTPILVVRLGFAGPPSARSRRNTDRIN